MTELKLLTNQLLKIKCKNNVQFHYQRTFLNQKASTLKTLKMTKFIKSQFNAYLSAFFYS